MTNNDILRRLRYTFDYNDHKMMEILASAGMEVDKQNVINWLRKDDDENFAEMEDVALATFLNGLINEKRGKRDGPQPIPEKELNNNLVLIKLRIAMNWQYDDIVETLLLTGIKFSTTEVSAFFRKPGTKKFRWCKDQFLRKLLIGMQKRYRSLDSE